LKVVYICLFLCLFFSISIIVKPSIFAKPNSSYFRFMLWWTGYNVKPKSLSEYDMSKPLSQTEAERIIRKWGITSALFIICLLVLIYFLNTA
jgi:hypothetical protein